MYDPALEGFSARMCAIDRCQIGLPPAEHLVRLNLVPPLAYRMTQFGVSSFDAHAMAASKVGALHSANRSVPRDIFDLSDLIAQGANPVPLFGLADRLSMRQVGKTCACASRKRSMHG